MSKSEFIQLLSKSFWVTNGFFNTNIVIEFFECFYDDLAKNAVNQLKDLNDILKWSYDGDIQLLKDKSKVCYDEQLKEDVQLFMQKVDDIKNIFNALKRELERFPSDRIRSIILNGKDVEIDGIVSNALYNYIVQKVKELDQRKNNLELAEPSHFRDVLIRLVIPDLIINKLDSDTSKIKASQVECSRKATGTNSSSTNYAKAYIQLSSSVLPQYKALLESLRILLKGQNVTTVDIISLKQWRDKLANVGDIGNIALELNEYVNSQRSLAIKQEFNEVIFNDVQNNVLEPLDKLVRFINDIDSTISVNDVIRSSKSLSEASRYFDVDEFYQVDDIAKFVDEVEGRIVEYKTQTSRIDYTSAITKAEQQLQQLASYSSNNTGVQVEAVAASIIDRFQSLASLSNESKGALKSIVAVSDADDEKVSYRRFLDMVEMTLNNDKFSIYRTLKSEYNLASVIQFLTSPDVENSLRTDNDADVKTLNSITLYLAALGMLVQSKINVPRYVYSAVADIILPTYNRLSFDKSNNQSAKYFWLSIRDILKPLEIGELDIEKQELVKGMSSIFGKSQKVASTLTLYKDGEGKFDSSRMSDNNEVMQILLALYGKKIVNYNDFADKLKEAFKTTTDTLALQQTIIDALVTKGDILMNQASEFKKPTGRQNVKLGSKIEAIVRTIGQYNPNPSSPTLQNQTVNVRPPDNKTKYDILLKNQSILHQLHVNVVSLVLLQNPDAKLTSVNDILKDVTVNYEQVENEAQSMQKFIQINPKEPHEKVMKSEEESNYESDALRFDDDIDQDGNNDAENMDSEITSNHNDLVSDDDIEDDPVGTQKQVDMQQMCSDYNAQKKQQLFESRLDRSLIKRGIRHLNLFQDKDRRVYSDCITQLKDEITRTYSLIKNPKELPMDLPDSEISKRKKQYILSMYDGIKKIVNQYYYMHYTFLIKDLRVYNMYAMKWEIYYREQEGRNATMEGGGNAISNSDMNNRQLVAKFFKIKSELEERVKQFIDEVGKLVSQNGVDKLWKDIPDPDDIDELREKRRGAIEYVSVVASKLNSIYNNNYSLMDVIMDSQFLMLYVVKVLRVVFIWAALYLADKIFEQMYMKQVYTQNKEPPNILLMLGIFLAIDFALNLFLLVILLLIKYLFKSQGNTFIIDGYFINKYIVDYLAFTVVASAIAVVVGSIIKKKRYFKYKIEGPRAIRAYQEIILGISAILMIIPFFMIV